MLEGCKGFFFLVSVKLMEQLRVAPPMVQMELPPFTSICRIKLQCTSLYRVYWTQDSNWGGGISKKWNFTLSNTLNLKLVNLGDKEEVNWTRNSEEMLQKKWTFTLSDTLNLEFRNFGIRKKWTFSHVKLGTWKHSWREREMLQLWEAAVFAKGVNW